MNKKTNLIYLVFMVIGFISVSTNAMDGKNNINQCPKDKYENYVNCFTTYDFTSNENAVKGLKQCLQQHRINDTEAKACNKEMYDDLYKAFGGGKK